jgi:hypothetical protein
MTGMETGLFPWKPWEPLTKRLASRLKRAGVMAHNNDNYMRLFWSCFMIEWCG